MVFDHYHTQTMLNDLQRDAEGILRPAAELQGCVIKVSPGVREAFGIFIDANFLELGKFELTNLLALCTTYNLSEFRITPTPDGLLIALEYDHKESSPVGRTPEAG